MLSVVVPVFNELQTVESVIEAIQRVEIPKEVIIVDDGSTDGTRELLKSKESLFGDNVKVYYHSHNRGKGGAIRTGFEKATGDILVIQDADLEYDPASLPDLVQPIMQGNAHVVYGSRFLNGANECSHWKYRLANWILTQTTNVLFGRHLTDVYTCYKVFTREVFDTLHLSSEGFEIEAEMTAQLLRSSFSIVEVPVTYTPRTKDEGKKIKFMDGITGILTLVRFRLQRVGNQRDISRVPKATI